VILVCGIYVEKVHSWYCRCACISWRARYSWVCRIGRHRVVRLGVAGRRSSPLATLYRFERVRSELFSSFSGDLTH
jgi:hypothetical protein